MQLGISLPARHSCRLVKGPKEISMQPETLRLQSNQVIDMWLIPKFQRLISLCAVSGEAKLRQVASTTKPLITQSPTAVVQTTQVEAGKQDVTYLTRISQLVLSCRPYKTNGFCCFIQSCYTCTWLSTNSTGAIYSNLVSKTNKGKH